MIFTDRQSGRLVAQRFLHSHGTVYKSQSLTYQLAGRVVKSPIDYIALRVRDAIRLPGSTLRDVY